MGEVIQDDVQIVVRVDAGAEEERAAARPEGGVRRLVLLTEVRLRLDDAPGGERRAAARDEDAAQEVARNRARRAQVEAARQRHAEGRYVVPRRSRTMRRSA